MLGEIAGAVRDGRVDPVELVEEAIRRIEAANPTLNAVVATRFDEALAEARSHDGAGALAGIPYLVKDLEDLAGLTTTKGSRLFADDPPATTDSGVAARLHAAGGIPVGKTNTPEFGWTGYTANEVFGVTRNPWNPERSPGGSSGGSAAALAAGLVPVATASDGGGSVRIPAAQVGLVGYKPTFGTFPRGSVPNWITFSMNGVIGRCVADVVLEASVLQGPSPGDFNGVPPVQLTPDRPARILATDSFKQGVSPVVTENFEATLEVLAGDCSFPVEHVPRLWSDLEQHPSISWLLIAAAELYESLLPEIDRKDLLDPGLQIMLPLGENVSTVDYVAAQRNRYAASLEVEELIGLDGVLVLPVTNCASWPAEGPLPTAIDGVGDSLGPMDAVNTMEGNLLGLPAVSVPMGQGPDGVPMGLQVIAPRFRDDLALGVATALEEARPWPLVADGYEPWPSP